MAACIRCKVNGRVQGVFFRASTQRQAHELGLTGYAKNLPDGSVEVLACGPEDALEVMRQWLWVGPPAAHVTAVDCKPAEVPAPDRFTTA